MRYLVVEQAENRRYNLKVSKIWQYIMELQEDLKQNCVSTKGRVLKIFCFWYGSRNLILLSQISLLKSSRKGVASFIIIQNDRKRNFGSQLNVFGNSTGGYLARN